MILAVVDRLQQVNATRPYSAKLAIDEKASCEAVLRTLQTAIGSLPSGPRGLTSGQRCPAVPGHR